MTTLTDQDSRALLDSLLVECVSIDASDLHLAPGMAPHFRAYSELCPAPGRPVLTALQTEAMAAALLSAAGAVAAPESLLGKRGSADGAITTPAGVRFRYNIFRRQGNLAIALRRLEDRFRSLEELRMPDSLYRLCDLRDGLVVVSGPTGAGKSTTLATLLDTINRSRTGHIVTIEDPIEYLHTPVKCVVNQRQVGMDVPSFNDALVDAMRQDPDVILVGEIRDLDTIRTSIIAAETGHLVFTTLHAADCVGAVERLVAVFPADEQDGIRRQLALVLRAVIAQHLLVAESSETTTPRRMVIPASEILMVTPAVANLIAASKSAQIYSAMETGTAVGMQTLEQDLARLWVAGRIPERVALGMARHPSLVRDRAALHGRVSNGGERPRGGGA